jgi:anti-anti-sigma factor
MAISTKTDTSQQVIQVSGRFDFSVQAEFRKAYESVEPTMQFIIDFREADYIDSSALGMLLLARDYAGGDKAKIEIVNCGAEIKNILEISNFQKLFKIS